MSVTVNANITKIKIVVSNILAIIIFLWSRETFLSPICKRLGGAAEFQAHMTYAIYSHTESSLFASFMLNECCVWMGAKIVQ